jgi:hypothetical protein
MDIDLDLVFDGNLDKPLASNSKSNKLLTENQWLVALNQFIKPAALEFNLILSSHSFRINYITGLLQKKKAFFL